MIHEPIKKLSLIFCCCMLSISSKGRENEIDRLSSRTEIINLISKIQSKIAAKDILTRDSITIGYFEINSIYRDITKDHAYKIDINKDGLTDLVIVSQYVYVIFSQPASTYKFLPIYPMSIAVEGLKLDSIGNEHGLATLLSRKKAGIYNRINSTN